MLLSRLIRRQRLVAFLQPAQKSLVVGVGGVEGDAPTVGAVHRVKPKRIRWEQFVGDVVHSSALRDDVLNDTQCVVLSVTDKFPIESSICESPKVKTEYVALVIVTPPALYVFIWLIDPPKLGVALIVTGIGIGIATADPLYAAPVCLA